MYRESFSGGLGMKKVDTGRTLPARLNNKHATGSSEKPTGETVSARHNYERDRTHLVKL